MEGRRGSSGGTALPCNRNVFSWGGAKSESDSPRMDYDVVIIGGSLGGAATATLLRRECPDIRVLVVERAPKFSRRVGEATVEISGYFLGRVLGLSKHLNESHLVKQGMRFWFANGDTQTLADS